MTDARNEFAEILQAMVMGEVMPDGTPVTSATIGALMAEQREQLEAEFGGDPE